MFQQENGVETAIKAVYRDLEYARTLIKKPHGEALDDSEESWTIVEGDGVISEPKKSILECSKGEVRRSTSLSREKYAGVKLGPKHS